jgi:hypothetical protein
VTDSWPSIWYRSSSLYVVGHFPPPTVSTMVQTYDTVQLLCYNAKYSYQTAPSPVPCSCSCSVTLRVAKSSCSWTSPSASPSQVPALPAPPSPVLLPCSSIFVPHVQLCLFAGPVCQLLWAFSVCYPSSSLPAPPGLDWARDSDTKPRAA